MKLIKITLFSLLISTFLMPSQVRAAGAGASGGLTLLEASGARSSSLAEAFSAVSNDISAFEYNPASLNSLSSGQASFMYQKGMVEDSYGHFAVGAPLRTGSFGLSFGYYNGGTIDLYDGTNTNTVTAQKDMTLSMGYARSFGKASFGMTGKYLSSELIGTYKATAYAADFGMQMPLSNRLRFGAAIQNMGNKMTYLSEGDSLPMIIRGGLTMNVLSSTMLLLDMPYYKNEAEVRPAVGVETTFGPLALRMGYRKSGSGNDFSFGTGFLLGRSNIDYSFGMSQDLQNEHRVSWSMRFGSDPRTNNVEFSKRKKAKESDVAQTTEKASALRTSQVKFQSTDDKKHTLGETAKKNEVPLVSVRRVYVVKSGETLGSIAKKVYGDSRQWKRIYTANKHLLNDDADLEVGQRISLP